MKQQHDLHEYNQMMAYCIKSLPLWHSVQFCINTRKNPSRRHCNVASTGYCEVNMHVDETMSGFFDINYHRVVLFLNINNRPISHNYRLFTIAHEAVHAWQKEIGLLRYCKVDDQIIQYWKGKVKDKLNMNASVKSHRRQPWERHANFFGVWLFIGFKIRKWLGLIK